mmetsp:Transcript_99030/g.279797  ORF Transcript_99030/g.279797 Transcript_99030/m.279797 type:complete len:262 (-) Transcript_99030:251-1036(-)
MLIRFRTPHNFADRFQLCSGASLLVEHRRHLAAHVLHVGFAFVQGLAPNLDSIQDALAFLFRCSQGRIRVRNHDGMGLGLVLNPAKLLAQLRDLTLALAKASFALGEATLRVRNLDAGLCQKLLGLHAGFLCARTRLDCANHSAFRLTNGHARLDELCSERSLCSTRVIRGVLGSSGLFPRRLQASPGVHQSLLELLPLFTCTSCHDLHLFALLHASQQLLTHLSLRFHEAVSFGLVSAETRLHNFEVGDETIFLPMRGLH